jgi:hypothetical protein
MGVLCVLMMGCASITHGTEQSVKIDTLTPEGKAIDGAECSLTNDKGEVFVRSGQSATVRRSGANLKISCTQSDQAPALGQAVSRVNAGMAGNILIGGAIGAAIDVGTGAGYNYPSWMQLIFGEERTYDRSAQQGDGPVAGVSVRSVAKAPTPSSVSPSASSNPAPSNEVSLDDLKALLPAKP